MITLLSKEDILAINKKLGYKCIDKGKVEFLISKLKSKKLSGNIKKNLSKIAAEIWFYIIISHPFEDGNKRTATEAMLLFLEINGAKLNISLSGIIYLSLKIANMDITIKELEKIIYEKLEVENK